MMMNNALETCLEINLTSLKENLSVIKKQVSDKTKILAVVKAFAYGSDAEQIAKELEHLKIDYLAVAYTNEGVALRQAGVQTPILVLHPQIINFKTIIKYNLEPSLYSFRVLKTFLNLAKEQGLNNYPTHIKFNTGLNRLGFTIHEAEKVIELTNAQNHINLTSIFSHLAASEDFNEKEFTLKQISTFKSISSIFEKTSKHAPFKHMCNTSGIFNYPEAHFDMVRTGIGLYGFGNDAKYDKLLKPIAALKSIISQIHQLEPGNTLGYNRAYTANTPIKTATIPIGHADGIGRQYSNKKGFIYINNQKAYIIGNVCMDMIMVDITNINCNEGDEVIIFNNQFKASSLAEAAKSISYEIITSASQRIKRVFCR